MKLAGLDLSKIDVNDLNRRDLGIMYTAFRSNYEKGYGAIDNSLVDDLILNLRKYIKINLIEVGLISRLENGDNSWRISPDSLRMAMAIYMLPTDGLIDREALPYIQALESLSNIEKINKIRSKPFSVNNLYELCAELQAEQNTLNITGFLDRSAAFIYEKVNDQLLRNAYVKLNAIEKNGTTPVDIALKIVHYLGILAYIEKRMRDVDYRILMNLYNADERNLRHLKNKVKHLLKLNIIALQDLPDYKTGSTVKSCGALLFRAKRVIGNNLGVASLPRDNTRIVPYF